MFKKNVFFNRRAEEEPYPSMSRGELIKLQQISEHSPTLGVTEKRDVKF
jgi:hypothetical protein